MFGDVIGVTQHVNLQECFLHLPLLIALLEQIVHLQTRQYFSSVVLSHPLE
jgi:hypothetical protein